MSEEHKFQVGDIVEWMGFRGTVTGFEPENLYSVEVHFIVDEGKCGGLEDLVRGGRLRCFHTQPSLKLIERPNKKVEVTRAQLREAIDGSWYVDGVTQTLSFDHLFERLGL